MRKSIAGVGLALMLTLVGCDQSGPAADETNAAAPAGQSYQDRLLSLDEGQRNATFIRAIRDADAEQTCQGVESSAYVGEYQGVPMWTARCVEGVDWAILIGQAGTAQVLTCAEAEQAGMPACTTRPTA